MLEVVDDQRLAGDQHPAADARAGREAHADQAVRAFARDRLEDELVGLLVVQVDRRSLRREDRPRDLDDRLEQSTMLALGRHHPGGNGCF